MSKVYFVLLTSLSDQSEQYRAATLDASDQNILRIALETANAAEGLAPEAPEAYATRDALLDQYALTTEAFVLQ